MVQIDRCVDYVIIGAGIVGLTLARELSIQHPQAKIAVIEKEAEVGLHASGRNSGVLHAGIYYKEESLKAKFCLEGSKAIAAYCDEYSLPIQRVGKVILPLKESDDAVLHMLYQRGLKNGAHVKLIDSLDLYEIEPFARTATNLALFSPNSAVVEPNVILQHIYNDLLRRKVIFYFNSFCSKIDIKQKKVLSTNHSIFYGHLFNTAGLFADAVAKACGLKERYTMIPFKGFYYELSKLSSIHINGLIYPVPDMNVPFLGVHFTRAINGKVYIGPTALPAMGREHYCGLNGINVFEASSSLMQLGHQYILNKQGFRSYVHNEIPRLFKSCFLASAQSLVPDIKDEDVIKSSKVGIRAQLLDRSRRELIMDFLIKRTSVLPIEGE